MRLSADIQFFFRSQVKGAYPKANLYLFGSRVDDSKKGGDVDILILNPEKVDASWLRSLRIAFFKKFGWQKLDILCYVSNEKNSFKELVLTDAIEL